MSEPRATEAEMTGRQTRACCYAGMFVLVAIDWTAVGGALFLALMDYVTAPATQPDTAK